MGHRYYNPGTGRFISQDPAGDGDNWYAYAGNSPTNGSDPSGLTHEEDFGAEDLYDDPSKDWQRWDPSWTDASANYQAGNYGNYDTYIGNRYAYTVFIGPGSMIDAMDNIPMSSGVGSPSAGGGFMSEAKPQQQQPDSFWDYLKREFQTGGHADNDHFAPPDVGLQTGTIVPSRGIGPSGKPKIHNPKFSSKKDAFEAAKRASKGGQDPIHHANPTVGDPHYHPADEAGEIIKNGVHYNYPP